MSQNSKALRRFFTLQSYAEKDIKMSQAPFDRIALMAMTHSSLIKTTDTSGAAR